jgi:hypothetical protein
MKADVGFRHFSSATVMTLLAALGPAPIAAAAPPVSEAGEPIYYPVTAPLPAGLACSFPLSVVSNGDRVQRIFSDENGKEVRVLQTGRGWELTFTNVESGSSLTLKRNGSAYHQRTNADGSLTVTASGHNVIILFPTDVPAGPSTIQYVGNVTYTVDVNGVFHLLKASGKQIDICAALSG